MWQAGAIRLDYDGAPSVFYVALLSTIIDLASITLVAWAEINLASIVLAARARRLLRSPRALRLAKRTSATVLGGAAATLAAQCRMVARNSCRRAAPDPRSLAS